MQECFIIESIVDDTLFPVLRNEWIKSMNYIQLIA